MKRALLLCACLSAPAAFAWDSACSKFTNKSLEASELAALRGEPCVPSAGPATARERWIGGVDEHRRLWELTREKAGLPAQVSATRTLTVFTGPDEVMIGEQSVPTLVPVPFAAASRVAYRSTSPGPPPRRSAIARCSPPWCPASSTVRAGCCRRSRRGPPMT